MLQLANITDDQREALGWALDLAFDDQDNYSKTNDPAADYGEEWPEVKAQKAAYCRSLAELAVYAGEVERWEDLAKRFEEI